MGGPPPPGITSLSRLTILTRGYQELCNTTALILGTDFYLVPQPGTWWACNKGLTPCVSAQVLNDSEDFCVMVQIMPRVFYHPAETLKNQYDEHPTRFQREAVSLPWPLCWD